MTNYGNDFASRLKYAMKIRKLKAVDLCNKTGLSSALISQYLSGKFEAKNDKAYILSSALKVSPTWLLGFSDDMFGDDSQIYTSANLNFIRIPLYAPICCGSGLFVDDQIESMIAVPSDGLSLSPDNYFAQRAKGDSMKDAGISDGDLLVFVKANVPENGMIGCFCIDENEAMCKKYKESGGIISLQPMNSEYDPVIVNPENTHFACIGRLKKVIKNFD